MRTSARGAVLAVVFFCSTVLTGQQTIDVDTYRYRGRVTDTSGEPLHSVQVTCTARRASVFRATTDARGEYVLTSSNGTCARLSFDLESFRPETFHDAGGEFLDVALIVGSVAEVVGPGPSLTGRVTNADGSPAGDASLWLRRLGGDQTEGARTDVRGRFTIPMGHDAAGDYSLCARGKGVFAGTACVSFAASEAVFKSRLALRLSRPSR